MYTQLPLDPPAFDPSIIARVITPQWVRAQIDAALATMAKGERLSFNSPKPDPSLEGTIEAVGDAFPHPKRTEALQKAVLEILVSVQSLGVLRAVPHGADRGLRSVRAWNTFVATGAVDPNHLHSLLDAPLPRAIGQGLWNAGFHAVVGVRKAAGLYAFAEDTPIKRVGDRAALPCDDAMIDLVAEEAAFMASAYGSGQAPLLMAADVFSCPKTGVSLEWADNQLLAPFLNVRTYGDRTMDVRPLGPYQGPKPIRCVAFTAPSGTLLMADWFRLPEFTEGVEPDKSDISSDLGIDARTRDHFERLGLLRVHTTNCVPSVVDDNGTIRVTRFDEEHDAFWEANTCTPDSFQRSDVPAPRVLGRVCCDLWDVTFADREVIVDVLMKGAARIQANGGKTERGHVVDNPITSRADARARLDAYAAEHTNYVVSLDVDKDSTLYLHMATGGNASLFHTTLGQTNLAPSPWFEDYFAITTTPIPLDDALVEVADWVQAPHPVA